MSVEADFTRSCEGCPKCAAVPWAPNRMDYHCMAEGARKGYAVSERGRFLPYVPAWCPRKEGGQT